MGDAQNLQNRPVRALVLGEVLWDIFEHTMRLGGAPLNFSAHVQRLGHEALLISTVGNDELGEATLREMAALGLNTSFLERTSCFETGTAHVKAGPGDLTRYVINRPAAYEIVGISDAEIQELKGLAPAWLYYGTLFPFHPQGKALLDRSLASFPMCSKFYDLNLRQGFYSADLVTELLASADVVKLNEEELAAVYEFTGLPSRPEAFCREGAARYGWRAACVTLGARGCAMLRGEEYVEAAGHTINVADTVGAGDAFAAAFMHGLICGWTVADTAALANRLGALVASRHGAIPDWTLKEALEL
jgi:fructokinase